MKRVKRSGFFSLIALSVIGGCAHNSREIASVGVAGAPQVQVQIVKRGAFDEISSPDFRGFVFQKSSADSSITWVPSIDQVHEAEKYFERFIRDSNPEVYIKLRAYRRQYFGYGADVARRIHAFFSCSPDTDLADPRAENKALENTDCHFSLNFEYSNRKVTGYRPVEAGVENIEDSEL